MNIIIMEYKIGDRIKIIEINKSLIKLTGGIGTIVQLTGDKKKYTGAI